MGGMLPSFSSNMDADEECELAVLRLAALIPSADRGFQIGEVNASRSRSEAEVSRSDAIVLSRSRRFANGDGVDFVSSTMLLLPPAMSDEFECVCWGSNICCWEEEDEDDCNDDVEFVGVMRCGGCKMIG